MTLAEFVKHLGKTAARGRCLLSLSFLLLLTGCSTYQPRNVNDVCSIFRGETDWYENAVDANKKWGTPIWVMMAIMHQESAFMRKAKPKRPWLLGIIPLPRSSSAYGYSQAQDPAWEDYKRSTGHRWADRDDFDDAIDFIGWYTHETQRQLGISKWDAYNQYLAYHEGRGGYRRGTWKKKSWLIKTAGIVKNRSAVYNRQLKTCKAELDDDIDGWFF